MAGTIIQQVTTWESPVGDRVDLCPDCERWFREQRSWPRDRRGQEFGRVHRRRHDSAAGCDYCDHRRAQTTRGQTRQTIRAFLALPLGPLQMRARWLDSVSEGDGDPWRHLRDYVRPESRQRLNHLGERICLEADTDGWRDGVEVLLD